MRYDKYYSPYGRNSQKDYGLTGRSGKKRAGSYRIRVKLLSSSPLQPHRVDQVVPGLYSGLLIFLETGKISSFPGRCGLLKSDDLTGTLYNIVYWRIIPFFPFGTVTPTSIRNRNFHSMYTNHEKELFPEMYAVTFLHGYHDQLDDGHAAYSCGKNH